MKNYDQSQNLIDWLTVTRAVAPKIFYEHPPAFVTPYTQSHVKKYPMSYPYPDQSEGPDCTLATSTQFVQILSVTF